MVNQAGSGQCFPAAAKVATPDGLKPMSALAVGDQVRTLTQRYAVLGVRAPIHMVTAGKAS